MATPARSQGSRTSQAHAPSFDILQDGPSLDKMHLHPSSSGEKDVNSLSRAVSELAIENYQNIPPASVALREAPEPKFIKAQIEQHVPRLQRPALSAQTFQPLARDENGDKTPTAAPAAQVPLPAAELPLKPGPTAPFASAIVSGQVAAQTASDHTLQEQVQKHLAATPISSTTQAIGAPATSTMSWQQKPPPPYEAAALKVPEVVDMVENTLSPALSGISEPSESFVGSSRTGSFSLPRIEDSLEELDRLEEQLEAVGALAKVKHVPAQTEETAAAGSPATQSGRLTKRTSMMSLNSKSSQQSLRRSASMTLRQKNQQPATTPTKKVDSPAGRSARPSASSTPSRSPTSKSTKAPTVAKFELPGEAVARKLKEQKEARQALIEKGQKTNAAPVKPRTVTKPSFELPGEAISRRKREQHEAKLRAEEEELRRKREFKARPFRNSSAPGVAPRETIASRARQAKLQEEEAKAKAAAAIKGKRLSLNPVRPASVAATVGTVRKATVPAAPAGQRPASSLDAAHRASRRQSTVSSSDGITNAKLRPKATPDAGVKTAREQAAERSRAASREWAEKKRRQELAQKQAQKREEDKGTA